MQKNLKILTFALVSLSSCIYAGTASAQTAARDAMDAAIEQSNGQYSEIDMPFWSLGMQQKAWNKPMEHMGEGQSKPGYSRYYWTPDLVLPLRIREGMHTLINFPSWELIENVYLGNESAFGVQKVAQNALMVFASNIDLVGMDTNMIVFGRSGNRYVFYLRSETFNTDRITNAVVDILINDAKYTPDETGQTPVASGAIASGGTFSGSSFSGIRGNSSSKKKKNGGDDDWLSDIEINPENLRFDIDVFVPNPADMEIAPERIWRDEIFTYIDFGPKALSMTERPIVNLLVQGTEVPIGFRTRGPNGRLMVVEGIGDLVLRNGKRLLCLKIRKDPSYGTEWVEYDKSVQPSWAPGPLITTPGSNTPAVQAGGASPYGAGAGNSSAGMNALGNMMAKSGNGMLSAGQIAQFSGSRGYQPQNMMNRYRSAPVETIAVELGSASEIAPLEQQWDNISRKNKDLLSGYEPYYSVDAVAEGESRDLFRLRIGPVGTIKDGDKLCNQLGRRGVTCMVVRTQ